MKLGWISLHRQLQNNWVWKEKPFSKGQAWVDILLECNHAENKVLIKGKLLTVARGESLNSLKTWAKKWGWTIGKVRRFFELLQKDSMIELKNESISTRLTVCNYNNYQHEQHAHETQTERTRNGDETQTDTNNNINNINNENNENNEDVYTLWQRTFGRTPNIPEYEETESFIKKYGYNQTYQTYKAASLRNIKSISYLMANIDSKGCLISYEDKKNKEEIREIK